MKKKYYAIYDKVAKRYLNIFTDINNDTAARGFHNLEKDKSTMIGQNPEDYRLYKIAEWDETTGIFSENEPEKVCDGGMNEDTGHAR